MTDDLIGRLASGAKPVSSNTVPTWLMLAAGIGTAGSVILLLAWLGLRGDFPAALANPIFWTKFAYPALLAVSGLFAVERLSRPGATGRKGFFAAIALFALTVVAGVVQMMGAAPEDMRVLMIGGTALICPFLIVATALPVLAATLLVMRRMAPVKLTVAGLAAGLLAGGIGAAVYSFHCGENGLPFLAMWYTLGVVLTAALGAILGRWALRW